MLQFGERKLFDHISFNVSDGDRIGLVGKNGAGKSTLLKCINGEIELESGTIATPNEFRIGYLSQDIDFEKGKTVREEAREAFQELNYIESRIGEITHELETRTDYESDAYTQLIEELTTLNEQLTLFNAEQPDALIARTLVGLGFKTEDLDRQTEEFSGGWRMRVELAKLLLQPNNLLLLDEPTNHLDLPSIIWFENFLKKFPGAVILVSHDRRFMDRTCNRTIELAAGKHYDFPVNYSQFEERMIDIREQQQATRNNQLKQIAQTERFINRFRAKNTKAKQVQSKIKQLEKIDLVEVDERDMTQLNIMIDHVPRSGKRVLTMEQVSKNYGELQVLDKIDLVLDRGEKIALIGRNGEGKSTINKIIVGEIEHQGKVELGHNVTVGYFAQDFYEHMDDKQTVLEYAEHQADPEYFTKARDFLGAFGFSGEDVDKKVSVLSGGERGRLGLCGMLMQPLNLLVLDEPTNHLDLISKDILRQALEMYTGTMILVSHDRDFLDGLVEKYYEVKDTQVREYVGDLDEYVREMDEELLQSSKTSGAKASGTNNDYHQRKEARRAVRKLESAISKLEDRIEKLEAQKEELGANLYDPEVFKTNEGQEMLKQMEDVKQELETATSDWEKKGIQLEKAEKDLEQFDQ